ncbi:MAG: hypothetical protein AAF580_01000 [Pseudomonadota bacterium]
MATVDEIGLPIIIAGAVVVLLLLLSLRRRARKSSEARDTAQMIAAVQTERDVLRAKHAVEVAELESKIEELHGTVQGDLTRTLQLKEMTQANAALQTERDNAIAQAQSAEGAAERLRVELANHTGHARDMPQLLSDRDRARNEVTALTETISTLRAELHEANERANHMAAEQARRARSEDGGLRDALAERDAARADAAAALSQVEQLQMQLALMEMSGGGTDEPVEGAQEELAELRATVEEQQKLISDLRANPAPGDGTADALAAAQSEARDAKARAEAASEQLSRLAYELDGMHERVTNAERSDHVSRNEVEKRDALLELRLQRIHELEHKLREQHGQLHATMRRAEIAEQTATALQAGELDDAQVAEAADLRQTLDEVRERNRSLMEEVERLTVAAAEGGIMNGDELATGPSPVDSETMNAMRSEIAELTARTQALTESESALKNTASHFEREYNRVKVSAQRAQAIDAGTIDELKATMRTMAEKFAAGDSAPSAAAEPSLKDRIRAYRQAKVSD